MADESMKPEGEMPFTGQRMFWGGFETIVDTAKAQRRSTPDRLNKPTRKERNMSDVRHAACARAQAKQRGRRMAAFIWYELMTPDPAGAKASTTRSSAGTSRAHSRRHRTTA